MVLIPEGILPTWYRRRMGCSKVHLRQNKRIIVGYQKHWCAKIVPSHSCDNLVSIFKFYSILRAGPALRRSGQLADLAGRFSLAEFARNFARNMERAACYQRVSQFFPLILASKCQARLSLCPVCGEKLRKGQHLFPFCNGLVLLCPCLILWFL